MPLTKLSRQWLECEWQKQLGHNSKNAIYDAEKVKDGEGKESGVVR